MMGQTVIKTTPYFPYEGKTPQASLQRGVQNLQQLAKLHRRLLQGVGSLPLKILQVQPVRLLPRPVLERRGGPLPPQTQE